MRIHTFELDLRGFIVKDHVHSTDDCTDGIGSFGIVKGGCRHAARRWHEE